MADLAKSAGALIAEVRTTLNNELLNSLRPIIGKMIEAAAELELALGGAAGPKPRAKRGGKRIQTKKAARGGKRSVNPRGALQNTMREVLQKAKGALRLSDLRDRVAANPLFKSRDALGLYNQIAGTIKLMPDVVKTPDKLYTLSTADGGAQPIDSRGKRKARRGYRRIKKAATDTGA